MNTTPRIVPLPLRLFVPLFTVLAVVVLYIFTHEFGHGFVVLLAGGQITGFSLFSAHIWYQANLGPGVASLVHLAGVGLPFLLWLAFLAVVPRRANPVLELIKVISAGGIINTFLVWILFPLLALFTTPPVDDSSKFLESTGLPPLLMAFLFLLVYAGGWALFLRKFSGWQAFRESLTQLSPAQPGARRTLAVLAGLVVFCVAASFALNGFRPDTGRAPRPQPPAGFAQVVQVDLSTAPRQAHPVYTFQIEQAQEAGVYLQLENVKTELFDVRLTGPGGFDQILLHAEGYYSDFDTAAYTARLEPGQYQLLLTSAASPGVLTVYQK